MFEYIYADMPQPHNGDVIHMVNIATYVSSRCTIPQKKNTWPDTFDFFVHMIVFQCHSNDRIGAL